MFRPTAIIASIVLAAGSLLLAGEPLPYTGVNLAGGEFYGPKPASSRLHGKNFVYPNAQEIDYFVGKGMNIFRVPFRWETLQPEAMKPLDADAFKLFKDSIELITAGKASPSSTRTTCPVLTASWSARTFATRSSPISGCVLPMSSRTTSWSGLAWLTSRRTRPASG